MTDHDTLYKCSHCGVEFSSTFDMVEGLIPNHNINVATYDDQVDACPGSLKVPYFDSDSRVLGKDAPNTA